MTQIAILSDSHDNIWNLDKALQQVAESGAQVLLHCGDLCAPFVLDQMAQAFAGPIHVIFGNNDGDGRLLQVIASKHSQVTLHGIYAEVAVANRQIALIHYPEPARRLAQSGQFDLVCYGHDHIKHVESIGECLLVNPGEIMGRFGEPGWGLYDCESGRYERRLLTA
ncbi:MAG: YfcE family phosphodiesterase [Caldilineaceae bacterium]|nr:YfcE family phosphodiesterase [Caldilineaceae bacterium]